MHNAHLFCNKTIVDLRFGRHGVLLNSKRNHIDLRSAILHGKRSGKSVQNINFVIFSAEDSRKHYKVLKQYDSHFILKRNYKFVRGAHWLRGRVLDSRPKGRGFEPHRRHCVVSLSKNINPSLVLVQPRKTRPFITERLLMDVKNQIKQTNKQKQVRRRNYILRGFVLSIL